MKNVINALLIAFIAGVLILNHQNAIHPTPVQIVPQVQVAPQVKKKSKPINWGALIHDWSIRIDWSWIPKKWPDIKPTPKPVTPPIVIPPIEPKPVTPPIEPKPEPPKLKIEDVKSYAQAQQYCTENNGNMLLVGEANWCQACRHMRNDITNSPIINSFLVKNKILLIYYLNTDKEERNILTNFGVSFNSLPLYTFIVNGKPVKWATGYTNPESFIFWAQQSF